MGFVCVAQVAWPMSAKTQVFSRPEPFDLTIEIRVNHSMNDSVKTKSREVQSPTELDHPFLI